MAGSLCQQVQIHTSCRVNADSHGLADGVLVATLAEYFAIQCSFIKKVLNGLYLDSFNGT